MSNPNFKVLYHYGFSELNNNDRTLVIKPNNGVFFKIKMILDGETSSLAAQFGNFDITLYDNATSASGIILARGIVNGSSTIDFTDFPIEFANGLTLGYRNQSPGTGTILIYYL